MSASSSSGTERTSVERRGSVRMLRMLPSAAAKRSKPSSISNVRDSGLLLSDDFA